MGRKKRRSKGGKRPPSTGSVAARWGLGVVVVALALFALVRLTARETPDVPDPDPSVMEPRVAAKIQAHRDAVFASPDSDEVWGQLGAVLHAHGLEEEAAVCYRQAIALDGSEFRWQYLLVHALDVTDHEAALEASARAMELRSDYPALLVVRARLLEERGELSEALSLYTEAATLDPRNAVAELALGRLAMGEGELDEAREHLEKAATLSPEAGAVQALLARLYRRSGDNEKAREAAQRAALSRETPAIVDPIHYRMRQESVASTALLKRAASAEEAGDRAEAEGIYRDLVALRPEDPDMRVRLADLLAREGPTGEAEEHYRAALAVREDHGPAHFGLAALLIRAGEHEEAIAHFRGSLEARPEHVPTLVSLASALDFRGRSEEAREHLGRALELEPASVSANRTLAALLFRQNAYAEAVPHFERVLEERPDWGRVHLQLGASLAMMGDYDVAWTHLERAKELGEDVPEDLLRSVELRVK